MTAPPFLTFPVRGKRDAIRARQRARQVASLLQFPLEEQACIAAGTFVVARQASSILRRFCMCFQIDASCLHVFARADATAPPALARPSFTSLDLDGLVRLAKPLPAGRTQTDADLGWLVSQIADPAGGLFEEIAKQNDEVLTLLHELRAYRKAVSEGQTPQPNAA